MTEVIDQQAADDGPEAEARLHVGVAATTTPSPPT